jgi:hypothetical protein
MWNELQFNTLLFITEKPSTNVRATGLELPRIYVSQALGLARSLNSCGKTLRVFTNDRDTVVELMARESPAGTIRMDVRQIEFPSWSLPETAPFFAAHHKLFLFSHFAQEEHPNCLLDADVVVNNNNLSMAKLFDQSPELDGWVYDISAQVFPAYGTHVVQADIRLLGVSHPFPRWYGGEFIVGRPRVFEYLHKQCQSYLQSYLSFLPRLHHVGDECIVSAAINHNGHHLALADAGASGLVVRHWTGPTLHVGKPCAELKQSLLWHLPDAKMALSHFHEHGSIGTLYTHLRWLSAYRHMRARPLALLRRTLSRPHGRPVPA